MQVDLTQSERRLIILALKMKPFRALIQEPATPYHTRQTYKGLTEKLLKDEELSSKIRETS